jgi:hypothetical protein
LECRPFINYLRFHFQETTVLQNQRIRPGDQLVFYHIETVKKFAMHCQSQHDNTMNSYFLVPLNYPNKFHCSLNGQHGKNGTAINGSVYLDDLEEIIATYPFTIQASHNADYENWMDVLPSDKKLTITSFVDDKCIVAAKIGGGGGDHVNSTFHLPLRTRVKIRFERRWKAKTPPTWSKSDNLAEELTETAYKKVLSPDTAQSPGIKKQFFCREYGKLSWFSVG